MNVVEAPEQGRVIDDSSTGVHWAPNELPDPSEDVLVFDTSQTCRGFWSSGFSADMVGPYARDRRKPVAWTYAPAEPGSPPPPEQPNAPPFPLSREEWDRADRSWDVLRTVREASPGVRTWMDNEMSAGRLLSPGRYDYDTVVAAWRAAGCPGADTAPAQDDESEGASEGPFMASDMTCGGLYVTEPKAERDLDADEVERRLNRAHELEAEVERLRENLFKKIRSLVAERESLDEIATRRGTLLDAVVATLGCTWDGVVSEIASLRERAEKAEADLKMIRSNTYEFDAAVRELLNEHLERVNASSGTAQPTKAGGE